MLRGPQLAIRVVQQNVDLAAPSGSILALFLFLPLLGAEVQHQNHHGCDESNQQDHDHHGDEGRPVEVEQSGGSESQQCGNQDSGKS